MCKVVCKVLLFLITLFNFSIVHAMTYIGLSDFGAYSHWSIRAPSGHGDVMLHNNATAGIFGGYRYIIDPNYYIGLEACIHFINMDTSTDNINGFDYSAKQERGYALSVLMAHYIFTYTNIYIRVGGINSTFGLEWENTDGSQSEDNKSAWGAEYGFGLETKIIGHINARIEYVYSDYRMIKFGENQLYPQNNQYELGVLWRIT